MSMKVKRTQTEELADASGLSEDNHQAILVQLPVKDVIRCGTACKAWRSITTDPAFLTENASRQPTEVILYRYVRRQVPLSWVSDVVLDAILISGDEASRRSLIRYRKPHNGGWLLLAVSDGMLLFRKAEGVYILCNPTTRRWADLPPLRPGEVFRVREFAFYFHQPSNQFRLLCGYRHQDLAVNWTWCILSTGEDRPRTIEPNANAAGGNELVPCLIKAVTTPVALHGRLHWPPQPAGPIAGRTNMAMFGMLSETFTKMEGPPAATGPNQVKLFVMDGLLVGADFCNTEHTDLWFLLETQNSSARWELRHRVTMQLLPERMMTVTAAADRDGNVMVGNCHGLVVYNASKEEIVKTISSVETPHNKNVVVSRHVFTASLVQHPHFTKRSAADFPFVHF